MTNIVSELVWVMKQKKAEYRKFERKKRQKCKVNTKIFMK